jgi:hypothetical protein
MPRKPEINLHAVDREFRRVLARIGTARKAAEKSEQGRLDTLLAKVTGAHQRATSLCPKALSVWPEEAAALRAKKPRGR